jgi:hypothetical protein
MSVKIPLAELEGLVIESVEDCDYNYGEATIVLQGGITITVIHGCCGCCDGPYEITAWRD